MKIAINKHIDSLLQPHVDGDTFRMAALCLFIFTSISFLMAALMIPPAKTIPLKETISLIKTMPVGTLQQSDLKPLNNAADSIAGMHESTQYGLLPIKAANGSTIFDSYKQKFTPATGITKTFSLIIFDVGLSKSLTADALNSLPKNTTLLISPYAQNAQELITSARAKGFEIWLFLPLQSKNSNLNDGGTKTIHSDAGLSDNEKNLLSVLGLATGYTGVIVNKDNVITTNDTVFKPLNDILNARGIKLIEADVSAFEFQKPKNDETIIFAPLSTGTINAARNFINGFDPTTELAPLSYQLQK